MDITYIKDNKTNIEELVSNIRASLEAIGFSGVSYHREILIDDSYSYFFVYEGDDGDCAIVRCYEQPTIIKEATPDGSLTTPKKYRGFILSNINFTDFSRLEELLLGKIIKPEI